jgi:hypothetical protein
MRRAAVPAVFACAHRRAARDHAGIDQRRYGAVHEAAAAVRYLADGLVGARSSSRSELETQRHRLAIHLAIVSACSLRAPGVVK